MTPEEFRQFMQRRQAPLPRAPEAPRAAATATESEASPDDAGAGMKTLGALGLGALGIALARRPGARKWLNEHWQDLYKGKGLPSELPLISKAPTSPVMSETERLGVGATRQLRDVLEQPWAKELLKQKPATVKGEEQRAVTDFLSAAGAGAPIAAATQHSLGSSPSWFREALAFRAARLPLEQQAKHYLGLESIPERIGPYWPRQAERDVFSLREPTGMFGELRTSLGGFQRERAFPTMQAGEQAGVKYADPRSAWLFREVTGVRLVETAKYIQKLENRVVFRDANAAKALTGEAHLIEGLPGSVKWYAPTKEEAKFIRDNLQDPRWGRLGFLKGWADSIARNPNLVNPLPHFLKNMLYKYGLSGGGPHVMRDMAEFWAGRSPRVALFKRYMPFDESGHTAAQLIHRTIGAIDRSTDPAPMAFAKLMLEMGGRANAWSSKMIFAKLDPALRFSRWNQYVQQGMHPMEAANHTWVDLIRYGTRSDVVDFWKGMPLNFFVPWRLGTVTSMWKQMMDHPIRAAAFISAIDLLREIRYRQTGRWPHLPIDYIETPIAQVLQAKDAKETGKALFAATAMTLAFGPGGAFVGATLNDLISDMQARGEWSRAANMFWGISQLYDGGKTALSMREAMARGDHAETVRLATRLIMTAAIAEHSALNYRPRRLMAALPEWGPWLKKSAEVKLAEAMQERRQATGEVAGRRRDLRREMTIEKRIDQMREQGAFK